MPYEEFPLPHSPTRLAEIAYGVIERIPCFRKRRRLRHRTRHIDAVPEEKCEREKERKE